MNTQGLNTCNMICWGIAVLAGVFVFSVAREPTSFVAALLVGVAFGAFIGIVLNRLFCGGAESTASHAAQTPGADASSANQADTARDGSSVAQPAPNAGAIAARAAEMAPKPNPPEANPPVANPPRGALPELPDEEVQAAQQARADKLAEEEERKRSPAIPVAPTESIGTNKSSVNANVMAERAAAGTPKADPPQASPPLAGDLRGNASEPSPSEADEAKAAKADEAAKAEAAAAAKATADAEAKAAAKAKAQEKAAAAKAAKTDAVESTPDYDKDGVKEGTGEGTRPEMLSAARDGAPDNLKEIKGIGPKLEQLCNALGVYHFDQIAGWSADEVAWVDANLKGFKGRVSRDEWVAQAKILATGGETEFSKRVEDGDVY